MEDMDKIEQKFASAIIINMYEYLIDCHKNSIKPSQTWIPFCIEMLEWQIQQLKE